MSAAADAKAELLRQPGDVRIGDTVRFSHGKTFIGGTVQTYQVTALGMLLGVRLESGTLIFVEAQKVKADRAGDYEIASVSSEDDARWIALSVLEGRALRLPIGMQLRTLARAVLGMEGKR